MRLAPFGWILVIATSGFSLLSVIVYLVTGTFTQAWLLASAVVFGAVVLAAATFAAIDRPSPQEAAAPEKATPLGDPELVSREVIYRTSAGEAVRLTYRWPDGTRELRHVAATIGEIHTHTEIETYIDALPPATATGDVDAALERALASRSLGATPPIQETA